jgi:hypothetical protein
VFGKPGIDKVLPAMPIRVIYHPVERHVSMERQGGEHIFRFRIPEQFTPGFDFCPWDAYKLRELFGGIGFPEEAFRFLNVAGRFREPRVSSEETVLTWSEFRQWQSLIRRLRSRRPSDGFPRLGIYGPEYKAVLIERERRRSLELSAGGVRHQKPLLFNVAAKAWRTGGAHWSESTREIYKLKMGHLTPVFGKLLLGEITPADISAFQRKRQKAEASPREINMEIAILRIVLRKHRLS